jgi:hypothetical protein
MLGLGLKESDAGSLGSPVEIPGFAPSFAP